MIEDEEWIKIENYNAGGLETWGQRGDLPTGRKRKRMDLSLGLNRLRIGAREGALSRGEIPSMEMAEMERKDQSQEQEEF